MVTKHLKSSYQNYTRDWLIGTRGLFTGEINDVQDLGWPKPQDSQFRTSGEWESSLDSMKLSHRSSHRIRSQMDQVTGCRFRMLSLPQPFTQVVCPSVWGQSKIFPSLWALPCRLASECLCLAGRISPRLAFSWKFQVAFRDREGVCGPWLPEVAHS